MESWFCLFFFLPLSALAMSSSSSLLLSPTSWALGCLQVPFLNLMPQFSTGRLCPVRDIWVSGDILGCDNYSGGKGADDAVVPRG
jgi:hypothetical protein